MSAERRELNLNKLGLGFSHLAALAEATRALLHEHGQSESDEILVNAKLNLQWLAEKANEFGDLIAEHA